METPALRHLMSAYFHQDWDLEGLDDRETVHAFVRESPGVHLALLLEIEALLKLDETEVAQQLEQAGCEVVPSPTSEGSYRAWLTELAAYARQATGES